MASQSSSLIGEPGYVSLLKPYQAALAASRRCKSSTPKQTCSIRPGKRRSDWHGNGTGLICDLLSRHQRDGLAGPGRPGPNNSRCEGAVGSIGTARLT